MKRQHKGRKEGGQKGKNEVTELRRGRQGEGTTAEVNSTVQEENVELVPAKPEGGRVMESSTIHEPSGRKDREASTDREGKQANTLVEKEEMLRCESFHPNDSDQYDELPPCKDAYTNIWRYIDMVTNVGSSDYLCRPVDVMVILSLEI